MLARAFEVIGLGLPGETAAACCVELAQAAGATRMVGGQADDLAAENVEWDVDSPDALATLEGIHRRKTGAMLEASLRLGAISAGGTDEQIQHLSAYGRGLGLAFQIVDDLLDTTGDQHAIGKRTGQDVHRGKLTFPALLGIDESRLRAKQMIHNAIEQLEAFGTQATSLVSLAHFVLERNR